METLWEGRRHAGDAGFFVFSMSAKGSVRLSGVSTVLQRDMVSYSQDNLDGIWRNR